jgi:hypothetical protein
LANASDSIDLWYFDEQNGYWKKEGRAGKEGNFYHAFVSHFSFWNCDVPYNFIELTGRILSNGQPLAGARISISSAAMGDRSDLTNSEGRFGGFIPKDELLLLKVEATCGNIFTQVFSQNIGPFASITNLNDISVIVQGATQVSGNISGCNNAIISGSYVVAGGQAYFPDASGNFSLSACGTSLTLTAYGSNPFEQGSTQTISLSGVNANVNLQCYHGNTPLMYAVSRNGCTRCVELLLAAPGIDVDIRDNQRHPQTPAEWAESKGMFHFVALIND